MQKEQNHIDLGLGRQFVANVVRQLEIVAHRYVFKML
jgi:hypothetical protein